MKTPEVEKVLRNMSATLKMYAADIDAMLTDKPEKKKSESKLRREAICDRRKKFLFSKIK